MPLKKLCLRHGIEITDAGLEFLKGLPLEHLEMHNCPLISEAGIEVFRDMYVAYSTEFLFNKCKRLTENVLSMFGVVRLTHEDPLPWWM